MYFRPKIFEFFENINLVFKKCWPIVKQVLTISKLLILLYFVMSVILTKKQNESSVRKYWSVIRSGTSVRSHSSVNPCVTFLRIYFENLTVITYFQESISKRNCPMRVLSKLQNAKHVKWKMVLFELIQRLEKKKK